jgi:hypothetical protein
MLPQKDSILIANLKISLVAIALNLLGLIFWGGLKLLCSPASGASLHLKLLCSLLLWDISKDSLIPWIIFQGR